MRSRPTTPDPVRDPPHPLAVYFDRLREGREQRYRDYDPEAGARKSRAVLTLVRDESVFFPIWLRYYSQFFSPDDIHVLDHQTSDGSTDGDGFVRIPVSHDGYDNLWMGEVLEEYHGRMCEEYDVVLTVDVDEIVAPNPGMGDLGRYIDRLDEPFINALGYELLHMRDSEPAFDPARPVLEQRGHWYANDGYDKPVLAMEAMSWVPGFHGRADGQFALDPDLRLIHLHRMDYELCQMRHRARARMPWSPSQLEARLGAHNRVTEDEEFERWFYTDSASLGVDIVVEPIPEIWKGLF